MADVNTNTATQTQEQGNGTQTNTTANANTTGAGADSTPKVKTEEEIRAELQKEYEKMADKRVTDAIKKKEKEWADKQAKEKMTEDERRQAEEQERLQAQAKRDLDLTIKGLKLDVVDAVQEMGLDAGFRNLIAVEDLATITDTFIEALTNDEGIITGYTDVFPKQLKNVQEDLAIQRFRKLGAEGESSYTLADESVTFDDPLPVSVEKKLYPYRQLFPRSYTLDDPVGGYKEG